MGLCTRRLKHFLLKAHLTFEKSRIKAQLSSTESFRFSTTATVLGRKVQFARKIRLHLFPCWNANLTSFSTEIMKRERFQTCLVFDVL